MPDLPQQLTSYHPSVYTPEEIEEARLDRLSEMIKEADEAAEELGESHRFRPEKHVPGSAGCAMIYHLASVLMDTVDRNLCGNATVLLDPKAYRYAHDAFQGLWNLYQHLATEDSLAEELQAAAATLAEAETAAHPT